MMLRRRLDAAVRESDAALEAEAVDEQRKTEGGLRQRPWWRVWER
jgi:hypothetical protein